MAKKPSVNYWDSKGGFGCWINKHQVILAVGPNDQAENGPVYRAAMQRFLELTIGPEVMPFQCLIDRYTEYLREHRAAGTHEGHATRLAVFSQTFGTCRVINLKASEIEEWANGNIRAGRWKPGTARAYLTSILACVRWAYRKAVIPKAPFLSLEMPSWGSRGLEAVLTREEEETAISKARGPFKDLVRVMAGTGARPGELRRAEVSHFDPLKEVIVLPAHRRARGEKLHKTSQATGRDRVIYLQDESLDIVRRRAERQKTGPLFRSNCPRRRGPDKGQYACYGKASLVRMFGLLRKKCGFKHMTAYSFRHTYAVRWLRAGKPIEWLAVVLGTSVQMIRDHYGHLADQTDIIREWMRRPQ